MSEYFNTDYHLKRAQDYVKHTQIEPLKFIYLVNATFRQLIQSTKIKLRQCTFEPDLVNELLLYKDIYVFSGNRKQIRQNKCFTVCYDKHLYNEFNWFLLAVNTINNHLASISDQLESYGIDKLEVNVARAVKMPISVKQSLYLHYLYSSIKGQTDRLARYLDEQTEAGNWE